LAAGSSSRPTSQTERETIPVRNETDAYVASVNTSLASEFAEFTKTVSSTDVRVGERFTYRLTVKNTTQGSDSVDLVQPAISDDLPPNVAVESLSQGCKEIDIQGGNEIICERFKLAPGETRTFEITVVAQTSGPTTNKATFRFTVPGISSLDLSETSEVSLDVKPPRPRRRP
jgi:uncharacterized repeat protein (TIGR01451 family)